MSQDLSQETETQNIEARLGDWAMPCDDDDTQSDVSLGLLLVISGPSGVGKDTVWQSAAPLLPSFCKAITCTTRARREHEIEGTDYYFVSDEEFDRLIREDQLLEWAEVHGNRYGVPAVPVLERLNEGHDVVCVIDVQGAIAVRGRVPISLLIFLRPPSDDSNTETQMLAQRLRQRAPLDDEELKLRLKTAAWELAQTQLYDHAIVNENIDDTARELTEIVLREKKRWARTHPTGQTAPNGDATAE